MNTECIFFFFFIALVVGYGICYFVQILRIISEIDFEHPKGESDHETHFQG
jgi:hypothetical protein